MKKIFMAVAMAATAAVLAGLLLLVCTQTLPQPANAAVAAAVSGSSPALAVSAALENAKSGALEGLAVVKKSYRLAEDMLVGYKASETGWFETDRAEDVLAILEESAALLDGRESVFTAETPFVPERGISGYRDESMLALVWHEYDQRYNTVTYAEVFLADASQLRRKLTDDTYGSSAHRFPTELAAECNAVLAVSGDFYRFRTIGINVYQRELYRCEGDKMDTCWVDSSGNFLFTRAGEILTESEARAYIEEHDILFTISFGPVMVENGVNVTPAAYYLGEAADYYPRACIGQDGELHYLMMVDNGGVTVSEMADMLAAKGVEKGFALDGGQTGTIVLNGKALNPNKYGSQRAMSDIIWFATAVPEGG